MSTSRPLVRRATRSANVLLVLLLPTLAHGGCGGSVESAPGNQEAGADSPPDSPPDGWDAGDGQDVADSADTADGTDAPDAQDPCPARHDSLEFIFANKGCATTADCTVAKTCLREAEGCGIIYAGTYLNSSYDPAKWKALEAALSSCGDKYCTTLGCDYVDPAICWRKTCWAHHGEQDQASRDECVQTLGRDSLCALCYCAFGDGLCGDDPTCTKLVQCAHDNACFGDPKCSPENATSPCKALVDAAGGPGNPSVAMFSGVNAGQRKHGCDVPCENP